MLLDHQLVAFAKAFRQPGQVVQYLRVLDTQTGRLNSSFQELRNFYGWRAGGTGESCGTRLVRLVITLLRLPSGLLKLLILIKYISPFPDPITSCVNARCVT
jgi:hypothetical protein